MPAVQNNCRAVRKAKGFRSQQGLAARAGMSPTTLVAIERYGHYPTLATRLKVAEALGVPVEDIWPAINGAPADLC